MGLSLLGNIVAGGCHKLPGAEQAKKRNFRDLLRRVVRHMSRDEDLAEEDEECLSKLGEDCAAYLSTKAHDSCAYAQLVSTLTELIQKLGIPQVESTFSSVEMLPF